MPELNKDEIIVVSIPRKDYEILRDMIERERALSWTKNQIRSFWVWALAAGVLGLWALGDRISGILK